MGKAPIQTKDNNFTSNSKTSQRIEDKKAKKVREGDQTTLNLNQALYI